MGLVWSGLMWWSGGRSASGLPLDVVWVLCLVVGCLACGLSSVVRLAVVCVSVVVVFMSAMWSVCARVIVLSCECGL